MLGRILHARKHLANPTKTESCRSNQAVSINFELQVISIGV
jgi:hypothetical protein